MNTRTAKFLLTLLILFMTVTVVNVIVHLFKNDYTTETAVAISASNTLSFKGVYVRDEEVLTYNGNGVLGYAVEDGGRLSTGEVAAYVYDNDEQISIKERISAIDEELDVLQKIQNPGTQEVAQPAYIASLIEEKYKSMVYSKEIGELSKMKSLKQELLIHLSTMQYVTNKVGSFSDRVATLEAEKRSLESRQTSPIGKITVPCSAYFASRVDGYEEILDYDKIDTLSASQIKGMNDSSPRENEKGVPVGKIIKGYNWKIVGVINDPRDIFSVGDEIKLYFPSSDNTLDAVIEKVRNGDSEEERIITISCTEMRADFVQHRVETVQIQDDAHKGIRISRDAIRIIEVEETDTDENDVSVIKKVPVKGVYIKLGEKIVFKKLDVIFEGPDYVVSRVTPDDDYVQLYDDTIIGGESLE